jgi:hypothetical protein
MKKAELVFDVIIVLGFIFRLMHWPYASEIMTLGVLFLAVLYFFFGFALLNNIGFRALFKAGSYIAISKLRIFAAIGTGIMFSMIVINMLFKVQFWPYGHVNLGIGLLFLAFVVAIAVLSFLLKRKLFLKNNYLRFILIGGLGLLVYSVNTDQLVDLYYGSDPEYAEEYKIYIKDDSPNAKRPTRAFKSR